MRKRNIWLSISCLICAFLVWKYSLALGESEFSGGRITGPILSLSDAGFMLFLVALVLSFFLPRIAAVAAALGSLSCLPLYIYFVAPGPFRHIFRGEYSVPAPSAFVWERWAILGILSIVVAAFVAIRTFVLKHPES